LATRVVVPLLAASEMPLVAQHLNPQFQINGVSVVMSTAELAGVPTRSLGEKVQSLSSRRTEIITAIDLLFTVI